MPIEANDLNGGLGVSFTARGVVTEDEYVDTLRKHLTQDKHKFEKYRYCIADWTEVSQMDVSTEAIKLIAWLSRKASTVNPYAIIATVADQDILYGLSRMAHTLRSETGWENEIF